MFAKRFLILAISALLLTACESGIDGEQYIIESLTTAEAVEETTKETTEETTIVFLAETTVAEETVSEPVTYSDEPTRYMTEIERYFYEQGLGDYYEDSKTLHMDLSKLLGEDGCFLSDSDDETPYFAEVENVKITNCAGLDWSFIGQFKNLKNLNISGDDVNVAPLSQYVYNLPLEQIYINSNTYDQTNAKALMALLPDCDIQFSCYNPSEQSVPWDNYFSNSDPIDGLFFFTQPTLKLAENPVAEWECRTLKIIDDYYEPWDVWTFESYLVCAFSNYTDEPRTVDSVRVFKGVEGESTLLSDESLLFKDGSDRLEIGLEIPARTHMDYIITNEMLDYSALESGLYRVEFVCGEEILDQIFFLAKENPTEEEIAEGKLYPEVSFLTDEQQEVFYKANSYMVDYFGCDGNLSPEEAKNLTVEEFVNRFCDAFTYEYAYENCEGRYINENGELTYETGGRGSDIGQYDEYFLPVYADDNDVVFQLVSIRAHSDVPYGIAFEVMNYHMLKTENGWRFDNFRIWY